MFEGWEGEIIGWLGLIGFIVSGGYVQYLCYIHTICH